MTGGAAAAWADLVPEENRVAVVSSGECNLGLALVRRLAEFEMRVVMGTHAVDRGRAALDQLGDLADRVAVRHLDLTDPGSVFRLARTVERQLGRCDVLMNNEANLVAVEDCAGACLRSGAGTCPHTVETILLGTWRLTQAIAPLMRRHRHGRIVNLASGIGGLDPMASVQRTDSLRQPALIILTRILSDELVGDGILTNACFVGPPEVTSERLDFSVAVTAAASLATLPDDGPTGAFFRDTDVIGR